MALEMMAPLLETLEKHLHTRTIFGEPMTVGNVTLIPVMDLTFGFGAGGGEGRDDKHGGSGQGGGGGARLAAKAVMSRSCRWAGAWPSTRSSTRFPASWRRSGR